MKRIVFLTAWLIGGLFISSKTWAQWKYEEYTNVLNGAKNPLNTGDTLTVSDTLLVTPGVKPAVTAVNEINNIISFAFNEPAQFGNTQLPDSFSVTINTTVSVWEDAGTGTTTRNFTITYSKNNPYRKSDIFYFNNGRRVKVEITGISAYNIDVNLAKTIVLLTNDMRIDRSYTTDCADCGVGAFNTYVNNITDNRDTLLVSWPANKWAKAYDLEWTYVSKEAYDDNRYGTPGSADFAQNVFRNNATRVTITDLWYNIPLLFNDNGYLYFRYRAVQQLANGERITSKWSPEYNLTSGLGKVWFTGHQNNLNWQAATSFAEEGKLKSAVRYYDGTLRERQSVTKDNVSNTTIVGESLYDHQGRLAISVLPAPTLGNVIQFTPLASTKLNAPGSEYVKDLYDGLMATADYCNGGAPGMGTDTGASRYYSPQNPLKQDGFNKYIPDAENFPFSEVKYTQDNTNRIAAKGGIGKQFQLGSKHDTKYYYASPSQNDLDALFGTDAGDAAHYEKNMVRDANGQYSVSYVDMKGRTVATALAGDAPPTLAQLNSYQSVDQTETLLNPVNNIVKDNRVVFSRSIAVPQDAYYHFKYTLSPQTLQLANWNNQPICYDCLYDLTITIADECNNQNLPGGVPYVYTKSNFSLNSINSNCSDPTRAFTDTFSVPLKEGSYTITKELSISQAGKEYYRTNIYTPNNLKTTFNDIYSQQAQLVQQQLGDCSTNGDIAKTDNDEVNTYADLMYAQMTGDGPYAQKYKSFYNMLSMLFPGNTALIRAFMLSAHPEYQVYVNYSQLVASNKWDDAMSTVNTYHDAVQAGYLNPLQMTTAPANSFPGSNPDPFFQNSDTYKKRMTDSLNMAMVTKTIRFLGRTIPVEWANLWSLSNMMIKCGVQNGLLDASCITQYKDASNVFNSSLLCPTEMDAAWTRFKTIYLAKKKMMTADFMFSQSYPILDNEQYRIFPDPRKYLNKDALGVDPYETDPAKLQQQAQDKLNSTISENCRNYAAYWWDKLVQAGCGFQKDRDSANIVNRLIAVCQAGGDETHPMGASTVKPGSTSTFKSFSEAIIDYVNNTPGVTQDITLCNGVLIDAPAPYERPFITVNKPITDKPDDCECKNIQGLYQVYQNSYASKYSTMSSFMQAVYKTTISDGALDTLRRMCNNEFNCMQLGNAGLSADLTLNSVTTGDFKATNSITLDAGFEGNPDFSAEVVSGGSTSVVALLPPVLQCGNVESVCADCEKVNSAYIAFTQVYTTVTPTKNEDTARKNTFFAGFMNDKTGLNKTATDYLNFIDQCNSTPGSYAGSVEIGTPCLNDQITLPSTGVAPPSSVNCTDLVKNYQNFIAEFPNHTHGATVRIYIPGGSTFEESQDAFRESYAVLSLRNKTQPGPNVADFRAVLRDTTKPSVKRSMTALAALPTGYWEDVTMNGQQLFEWYMNQHFNLNYTYLNYADWLINGCGYKLNQLPWSDTVAVRADTLQNIWNRFVARYPASQTSISETVSIPVIKGVTSITLASTDYYDPEYFNAMTWTSGDWYTSRAASTYNLSVLPKNATIQSAYLSLYANNPSYSYAAHFRYVYDAPYLQIQQVKGLYIPGMSTFYTQPDYYAGVPAVNLAPLSTDQVGSGNSDDFWSNQNYPNQDVLGLISSMYSNMLSTGVNYPVQYKLSDESSDYKKFQFGGTGCADITKRPTLDVSYSASRCEVFAAFVNNALGTYMNLSDIKDMFAAKGKMVINDDCTGYSGGPGCGNSVKVYASDLLLCDDNTQPTFIPIPASALPNACKDSVSMAWAATQEMYNFRRDSLLGNFDNAYTQKCLSAGAFETLTMTSQISEYHYTLYYYDQAGNLVKTVPPAGVVVNRDPGWLQQVKDKRAAGQTLTPLHTLYTVYRYNSLNHVISQYSPDEGQTNFWYDRLGRVAVSRNAEQKKTNLYSYTLYDELGRVIEVGQKQQPNGMTDATARDVDLLNNWMNLNNTTYPHTQVTKTWFDKPAYINQVYTNFNQKSYTLRNRISYVQYFDQLDYSNNIPTYLNHTQATYFNYDILGNVDTLLNDYASGAMAANGYNRFKLVAYGYDLVGGKVNLVSYQPGKQDEMYHRLVYDAQNRITEVYTTHRKAFVGDRNVEERDGQYSYYLHGPLARMEIGNNKVQGVDYAYTLQGWLKGVNSTSLIPTFDMGADGSNTSSLTARDAIGFSLSYYSGDYKSINATVYPFAEGSGYVPGYKSLYDGNISYMSMGIKGMQTMLYNYGYDQLNRLVNMNAFNGFDSLNNQWNMPAPAGKYAESATYDENGNIASYNRDGDQAGTSVAMDRLHYNYITGTNQLDHITDDVTDDARYANDLDGQTAGNYVYDAIGELTQDNKENIGKIEWTVYGKIKRIEKKNGMNIDYTYDAEGYRISKTLSGTGVTGGPVTTWYARDAHGNVLSTYTITATDITADEQYVYGSSRLGAKKRNLALNSSLSIAFRTVPGIGTVYDDEMMRGKTQYELSNLQGNVLATISDRKVPHITGGSVDYYEPEIISAQDYYPFGMLEPGRSYNSGGYRFGFNGKESDNEVKGEGNQLDYIDRIYDPRVGRFLSVDPLAEKSPEVSPYHFVGNSPLSRVDPDGKWDVEVHTYHDRAKGGYAVFIVRNNKGVEIYRTTVKAIGSKGRDRSVEGADTPQGVYKILEWRQTGNAHYDRKRYGPNPLLAMYYKGGEGGKRQGMHVHGGRQEGDYTKRKELMETHGCLRINDNDLKELKTITDQLEKSDPTEKKGKLTVTDDLKDPVKYNKEDDNARHNVGIAQFPKNSTTPSNSPNSATTESIPPFVLPKKMENIRIDNTYVKPAVIPFVPVKKPVSPKKR